MVTNQLPRKPGDMIGRDAAGYTIEKLIGEGGMGAVYSAYSALLGKRAAVKVMLGEYTDNPEVVERFGREAIAVARVQDLNIIDVYAASRFHEDGRMYIVMPFIEGGSLEQMCERSGPLPLDMTAAVMLQVCSGLEAVHSVAIVHRDIKAANILVTQRYGRSHFVYIVDFGIAKLLDPHLAANFRTQTKAVLGTVGCMAPEQARGDRDVDARADVYSVGMVLYRMLVGRQPYEADSLYALMEKQIQNAPFPRPRKIRPEIPRVIEDLILDCLQPDRANRPSSMCEVGQIIASGVPNGDEMLRVLAPRLRLGAPTGPSAPTLTGTVEGAFAQSVLRSARSRVPMFVAAGMAGAVLSAGAVTLFIKKHPSTPIVASGSAADAAVAAVVPDARELTVQTPPLDATTQPDAAVVAVAALDAGLPPNDAKKAPLPVPHHEHHPTIDPTAQAATTGTLIVKVTPHAEVYLDDAYSGTTPVRKLLSVGTHHVKLVGIDKQEELDINVTGKETTISRTW